MNGGPAFFPSNYSSMLSAGSGAHFAAPAFSVHPGRDPSMVCSYDDFVNIFRPLCMCSVDTAYCWHGLSVWWSKVPHMITF